MKKKKNTLSVGAANKKKKLWVWAAVITLVLFLLSTFAFSIIYAPPAIPRNSTSQASPTTPLPQAKPGNVVTPDLKKAIIETKKGNIVIALFEKDAPTTTQNFEKLIKAGAFDGLTFYHVVKDFVAQAGDPESENPKEPGNTPSNELIGNPNHHIRGAVSMVQSNVNKDSSQFLIAYQPQPYLDSKYPVFGQVVEGMDVVEKLTQGDRMIKVHMAE